MDEKYLNGMVETSRMRPATRSSFVEQNLYSGFRARSLARQQQDKPVQKPWRQDIFRRKAEKQNTETAENESFLGDEPEKIMQGMMVEHQRFGIGKVIKIEGVSPNKKATVFFQNAGQKQLLLKFAKLKIKR
jgi:DNA helicase-2/ATP-dependent DNA helicase PcrA